MSCAGVGNVAADGAVAGEQPTDAAASGEGAEAAEDAPQLALLGDAVPALELEPSLAGPRAIELCAKHLGVNHTESVAALAMLQEQTQKQEAESSSEQVLAINAINAFLEPMKNSCEEKSATPVRSGSMIRHGWMSLASPSARGGVVCAA